MRRWLRALGVEKHLRQITTTRTEVFHFADGQVFQLPAGQAAVTEAVERQFPGAGPAMAQVALEAIGQSVDLACVPQAKFLAPLGPDVDILLTLSKGRREGRWECTLHSGETLAARIQVEVAAL